jgi:hypothetical protein
LHDRSRTSSGPAERSSALAPPATADFGGVLSGLYPDLRAAVPGHFTIQHDHQREYLRFSDLVANTGEGALTLRPEHDPATGITTGYRRGRRTDDQDDVLHDRRHTLDQLPSEARQQGQSEGRAGLAQLVRRDAVRRGPESLTGVASFESPPAL